MHFINNEQYINDFLLEFQDNNNFYTEKISNVAKKFFFTH